MWSIFAAMIGKAFAVGWYATRREKKLLAARNRERDTEEAS